MPTDREVFRSRHPLPGEDPPARRGSVQPVTGRRRVPEQRELSSGTAGTLRKPPFAAACGSYQVLIRVEYLRTQLQASRATGLLGSGGVDDVLWSLRGIVAAARSAGLTGYERLCEGLAANLEALHPCSPVSYAMLQPLAAWLARTERWLRHPQSGAVLPAPGPLAG
jgi:hypothetical protein